jgi:hypothetical protein
MSRSRNFLRSLDDDGLRTLDWKKLVGKYLVDAKKLALEYLDEAIDKEGSPPPIEDLTERLRKLAEETDVRHLPDYPPVNPARLAQPLDEIQRTKALFRPGEKLTITLDRSEYEVALSSNWLPSEYLPIPTAEQQLSNDSDMVLVIRKPDFLGKSQWQFRHGKASLSAPIQDEDWLQQFHEGKHPVKPGDALRVRVRFEYKYDVKGDLIEQKASILVVYGVIQAPPAPKGLFFVTDEDYESPEEI